MSWTSASTCNPGGRPEGRGQPDGPVRPDGSATTASGSTLWLVRAGGPWGRARGLLAQPDLIADDTFPTALWLGRTPQVHTFGMGGPIAVVTADAARRGARRGRPCALRVRRVDVLDPNKLGRWSWDAPFTLELHPLAADRLGLTAGSPLDLEWGRSSGSDPT